MERRRQEEDNVAQMEEEEREVRYFKDKYGYNKDYNIKIKIYMNISFV